MGAGRGRVVSSPKMCQRSLGLPGHRPHLFESATVQRMPVTEQGALTWPYDENGRLADPAEWQQQFMLGLHDLWSDAAEADFPRELIDELNQLRLRFMDEFERRFPGYGKGRAVWR